MQQFFSNRYTQLALISLGLGTLFFLIFWLVFSLLGVAEPPLGLLAMGAYLGGGVIVAKFLAGRIF